MSWRLNAEDREFLAAVGRLGFANPFLPERIELERAILGRQFIAGEAVWSVQHVHEQPSQNLLRISAQACTAVDRIREQIAADHALRADDLQLYSDAALYVLITSNLAAFACRPPMTTHICLRFSFSCGEHSSMFSISLLVARPRQRVCEQLFGNRFLLTTCAATSVRCGAIWTTRPR